MKRKRKFVLTDKQFCLKMASSKRVAVFSENAPTPKAPYSQVRFLNALKVLFYYLNFNVKLHLLVSKVPLNM